VEGNFVLEEIMGVGRQELGRKVYSLAVLQILIVSLQFHFDILTT
jgi:hypothetical protein